MIGALVLWEGRMEERGGEPLFRPSLFRSVRLTGGLVAFFFQFMIQSGLFFTVPLFLSVVLELSAVQTGVRILPLSVTLLLAAVLIPRLAPRASPRLVARVGLLAILAGTLVLVGGLDPTANAGIVLIPMALVGLGVGSLASQLGAITVSGAPESQSAQVGGLQNTFTNFGASLGTALVGAVLIGTLTSGLVHGVSNNPAIPPTVSTKAAVQIEGGVPFLSDTQVREALASTDLSPESRAAVVSENASARLYGLRSALWVVVLLTLAALFCTGLLPRRSLVAGNGSIPQHENEG